MALKIKYLTRLEPLIPQAVDVEPVVITTVVVQVVVEPILVVTGHHHTGHHDCFVDSSYFTAI